MRFPQALFIVEETLLLAAETHVVAVKYNIRSVCKGRPANNKWKMSITEDKI